MHEVIDNAAFQRHSVKVACIGCYTEVFLQYPKNTELFLYTNVRQTA